MSGASDKRRVLNVSREGKHLQTDRLLILDDDPEMCDFVKDVAQDLGFAVIVPSLSADLRQSLASFQPSVIFLDLLMPEMDGVEVIRRLGEEGSTAQIVLASGQDRQILQTAKRLAEKRGLKVANSLRKPIQLRDLETTLQQVRSAGTELDEAALAHAIAAGELIVQYQPKAVMQGESAWRVHSLEALVRWEHPDFGLLAPDSFIQLAERSNLIVGLTDYVIEAVLKQLGAWRQRRLDVPVAVNLSARFIDDLDLPNRLVRVLAEHGIDPGLIILEITESSAMADVSRAMDVLTRLRLKGFKLSVDDFGTGYSSLIQLYRMPFSELKIDREFVRGLPDDPESATIVRGIVSLAHALELTVCVEGVETQAAFALLQDYECDLFQGYHFSPPLPSAEATRLVEARRAARPCQTRMDEARPLPY